MGSFLAVLFSGVGGLGLLGAFLIFRKRGSTKGQHKFHTLICGVAGYGLAFVTGAILLGVGFLIKIVLDPLADWLSSWIWSFLWPIPAVIKLLPLAVPYALLLAIPYIVIKEVVPAKWLPSKIRSHFSSTETHHTPWLALFIVGIVAQVPLFSSAFHLEALTQAVYG